MKKLARNKILQFVLLAFVAQAGVHVLAFSLGLWIFTHPPGPATFDAALWKRPESYNSRFRMAEDLVARNLLVGKTKDQLLELLGKPSQPAVTDLSATTDLYCYSVPYFPDITGYRTLLVGIKGNYVTFLNFEEICDPGPKVYGKLCPWFYQGLQYNVWSNTLDMLRGLLSQSKC